MRPASEGGFQRAVLQLARVNRWRSAHFRKARTAKGWRTAIAGDGKGFPDLVLVRGNRLVVAELKSETGRLSHPQRRWLSAFRAVPGVEVWVWKPGDWDTIKVVLA